MHPSLYLGLAFVLIGIMVKIFPNSIAGYNTMSKENKKKIDIKGLSSTLCKVLVVGGGTIFLANYLFIYTELLGMTYIINAISIIILPIIGYIKTKKYQPKK